jgi:hypothetical protein
VPVNVIVRVSQFIIKVKMFKIFLKIYNWLDEEPWNSLNDEENTVGK